MDPMGKADEESSTLEQDAEVFEGEAYAKLFKSAKRMVEAYVKRIRSTGPELNEAYPTLSVSPMRMVEAYAKLISARPMLPVHRELLLHMPWFSPRMRRAMKA